MQVRPPLPRVDDGDLAEVYNAEDVFASTTRREEGDDILDTHPDDY